MIFAFSRKGSWTVRQQVAIDRDWSLVRPWRGCPYQDIFDVPNKVLEEAKRMGWGGDVSEFGVFVDPSSGAEFEIGVVWKESNNGTTWVAVPTPDKAPSRWYYDTLERRVSL